MYKTATKICNQCGKQFQTNKPNQSYCSRQCANRHRASTLHHNYTDKVEMKCQRCGKNYYVIPSRKTTSHFCSIKCKNTISVEIKTEHTCRWCRNTFMSSDNVEFCSKKCNDRAKEILNDPNYDMYYPNIGKEMTKKECPTCGKSFIGQLYFCDAICYNNSYFINKDIYKQNFDKINYYLSQRDKGGQ